MSDTTTVPVRRKRSKFLICFLILQLLMLLWVVSAFASASGNDATASCTSGGYLTAQDCNSASDAGSAIAGVLLIVFWAILDIIVGGTYAIIRLARR